jgi:UDP-glucose 4-epimerase
VRIAITGAFGYVGAHLTARLLARGDVVSAVDRTPAAPDLPAHVARVPARIADVADAASLAGAFDGCEAVVHAAALSAPACARDPAEGLRVNGLGTRVVLDEARRAGVRRVVYFSTAHVYGELKGRIDESTPVRPLSPYGFSKAAGEEACFGAAQEGGREVFVVRFSNGFGAPLALSAECWSLALPSFVRAAAETGRIVLRTAGTQQRDFLTISDMVRAVETLLTAPFRGAQDIACNAGGGRSLSMREAAALVARAYEGLTGIRPPIDLPLGTEEAPPEPPVDYRCDRLAALGWRPAGDLAAEARATLEMLGVGSRA